MDVLWFGLGAVALLLAALACFAWRWASRLMARRTADEEASPSDHGLAYQDVCFTSRDGITLRGWFIPGAAARCAVIFCHGHGGSMDPDVIYAPWLHQAGFSVLMFDFRAHGRSDGERVSMGYLERQDLLGAVDFLRQRGIDRLGVLGFSMGGAVAMSTAPHSEAIRAVISDGGFARLENALLGWSSRRRNLPSWLTLPLTRLVIAVAGWRLGGRLPEADPIRWVGRIAPRPLLLIHGDRDVYVTVKDVQALYQAAGEPKELWRVAEAEHRRVDRVRPDEYRERVVGFFRRHLLSS